ncbi:phosphatase PAP2 family protein [Bacillus alkalicola]|uniref:Phosphatase PAP2 family protein n=1 Tax=Evansella alkalicola TaxID=745819 RepID=A0ABS6JUT2_9BACI|nr:phosphatase PAP2 family protein [Bacillus alkalicola]
MYLRELETEILRFFTNLQNPFLNEVARVLTFLGDETFYFIIIPFVYWCFSKSFGIRLLYVFLFSVYTNAFLKSIFPITRPIYVEGVNSLYVYSAEVGTHFPHDSFPSGHAQGSATLWGFMAYWINRPAVWVSAGLLIFLIAVARLFTGVHWPLDILAGVAIAAIIITIYHIIVEKIVSLPLKWKLVLAIVVPLIMMVVFRDSEGFSYGGFLLGAGIGFFLEQKYIKMEIPKSWLKRISAYVIGIIVIFVLQTGLKVLFPEMALFDGLRYALIGLWGIFGAPYLFVKTGLYRKKY